MRSAQRTINPWISVIAVAFGYFVDLYDLLLFSSVRVASLKELGYTGESATYYTTNLMNLTVLGMVVGGFVWGILADKRGRLSVLFLSIITYSLANFVNAYVHDIATYQACRFVAGFGLAGELGVGITLVSEILAKEKRTTATMIISATGMFGAVTAGLLTNSLKGQEILGMSSWRFLFLLGGILGSMVLLFRVTIFESTLFKAVKQTKTKGNLFFLLSDRKRALRFLYCILSGLPIFFIIGIFITLSPEYGKNFGLTGIQPSTAVIWCYISIGVFDIIGTWLSKKMKSRKKILYLFLIIQTISIIAFLFVPSHSNFEFYTRCALLGMGIGGWGVLIVNSAEQFGTNLRATVATSVPNLIRGALFPLSQFFFSPLKPHLGIVYSAAIVVGVSLIIAFFSVSRLKDKFETSVDFEEENKSTRTELVREKILVHE